MAAEHSGNTPEHDPWESVIDEAIRKILSEAGSSAKTRARGGDLMEALTRASASRAESQTSSVEKLLLAQIYASALADALAPALADALAPEIMKALEHQVSDSQAGDLASASSPAKGRARGQKRT
ncbi:hypothetical protein [Nonomuraea sp. B1E8]|uniref:hypothetical protein n=1 Tax=unclassified Nonomuraea TaxID=2593643 RepID=UPI00325C6DEF